MSAHNSTFLELYARHAAPELAHELQAREQRFEAARVRTAVVFPPGVSPMAPPYQVFPARVVPPNGERAA